MSLLTQSQLAEIAERWARVVLAAPRADVAALLAHIKEITRRAELAETLALEVRRHYVGTMGRPIRLALFAYDAAKKETP